MSYEGKCLCGNVKFSFEYDPMMHFQCHCTMCQRAFGTTSNALVLPEDELTIEGELKRYSMTGELWTDDKAKWLKQADTIENSFVDNGTVERLGELLENLDQRE